MPRLQGVWNWKSLFVANISVKIYSAAHRNTGKAVPRVARARVPGLVLSGSTPGERIFCT